MKKTPLLNVALMAHEQFKALSQHSRAIFRTGECQPYCNIVLVAGVTF